MSCAVSTKEADEVRSGTGQSSVTPMMNALATFSNLRYTLLILVNCGFISNMNLDSWGVNDYAFLCEVPVLLFEILVRTTFLCASVQNGSLIVGLLSRLRYQVAMPYRFVR